MQLSENFSLNELIYSDTAIRKNISNDPNEEQINNLKLLCENILEPVRINFNSPVIINSGYRSPEVCLAVGSTIKSQHTKGQAADFEIVGIANKDLADWIVSNLDYDQCILEFWNEKEPNSGWVHCSYSSSGNRKQYLKAQRIDGKIVYSSMV
jgi:zinc D-Ala-D-Ala carboxypeptidase